MQAIDYLRVLRRRWPVVLACVVAALIPAWMAEPARTSRPVRTFEATHTLIRAVDEGGGPVPTRGLSRSALLTTTGEVPRLVAERLGFSGDPAVLATQVEAVADEEVGSLAIRASNNDGQRAAELANAFAEELIGYLAASAEQTRQRSLELTLQGIQELQASIRELDAVIASGGRPGEALDLTRAQRDAQVRQYGLSYDRLQQLAVPVPSDAASGFVTLQAATPIPIVRGGLAPPSSRPGRVAAAIAAGLVIGAGIALVREHSNPRVRSRQAAEAAFQLPVVVEVPRAPRRRRHELAVVDAPQSHVADAYRILRTSLRWAPARPAVPSAAGPARPTEGAPSDWPALGQGREDGVIVLVTSAGGGEAKTTTVANLAAALAEAGHSVLMVDADLRHAGLHEMFGLPAGPGLVEVLRGEIGPAEAARSTGVAGVRLLSAGNAVANPARLLSRHPGWVEKVRSMADVVLVDTGAVLESNEASELAPHVNSMLLIARLSHTRPVPAARTSELLARMGAPVLGLVLVGTRAFSGPRWDITAFRRTPAPGDDGPPEAEAAMNGNGARGGHAPVKGPVPAESASRRAAPTAGRSDPVQRAVPTADPQPGWRIWTRRLYPPKDDRGRRWL
ncbi:MAG: AAA family ATPase [Acidimicrobiales bacterium]